jgi:hypothetical protein
MHDGPHPTFRSELALVSDHSDPTKVAQNLELVIGKAKAAGFELSRRSVFEITEAGELRTPVPPCGACGRYHRGPCEDAAEPELPEWMRGAA